MKTSEIEVGEVYYYDGSTTWEQYTSGHKRVRVLDTRPGWSQGGYSSTLRRKSTDTETEAGVVPLPEHISRRVHETRRTGVLVEVLDSSGESYVIRVFYVVQAKGLRGKYAETKAHVEQYLRKQQEARAQRDRDEAARRDQQQRLFDRFGALGIQASTPHFTRNGGVVLTPEMAEKVLAMLEEKP